MPARAHNRHGRAIFKAPVGRSLAQFLDESAHHGWPSFRDDKVDFRVLPGGEVVTIEGVHLGHNERAARGARAPLCPTATLTDTRLARFLVSRGAAPRRQEPLLHQPRLYVVLLLHLAWPD
jgi:hypothetical protein